MKIVQYQCKLIANQSPLLFGLTFLNCANLQETSLDVDGFSKKDLSHWDSHLRQNFVILYYIAIWKGMVTVLGTCVILTYVATTYLKRIILTILFEQLKSEKKMGQILNFLCHSVCWKIGKCFSETLFSKKWIWICFANILDCF